MNLVLLSGGVDSTTALFWSKRECSTHALILKYPSRHNKREIACAMQICANEGIPYTLLDISSIFANFASALLQNSNESVPHSDYTTDSLAKLVIPFRNGIFVSIAAGIAQSLQCDTLVLANHAGDHPLYPDCTHAFIESMSESIRLGSGGLVNLCSPFCDWDKTGIVRLGIRLGVDYSATYSCYEGGEKHCNVCPTCKESLESFQANGIHVER